MKKWKKRSLSLLLAGVMLFGLLGCGERKTDPALVAAAKENVYRYVNVSLFDEENSEGEVDNSINAMNYVDGRVLAFVNKNYWGNDEWYQEYQIVSVKEDGTDRQTVSLWRRDENNSGDGYLQSYTFTDHYLYVVNQSENYEVVNEYGIPEIKSELICLDVSGQELWRTSAIPEDMGEDEYFYVESLMDAGNDRVMVYAVNTLTTYDKDGKIVSKVKLETEGSVSSIFVNKDGEAGVCMWNTDWTELSYARLNLQTGELGEVTPFPFNANSYSIKSSKYHDMLLTDSLGVYYYNIGDEQPTPMMNYINSDLNTYTLYQLVEISETEFLGTYYDQTDYKQNISLFTYVDPSEIADKVVLKLAAYYIPTSMKKRVIEFNKTNEKYRIIISDYSQYATTDDYMAGYTKFNNDILAGNVPDIIVLDDEMPVDSYIEKGLLADIYSFMETDEEINREDYFQNVFDAFSVDGKLYSIVPSFYVQTVMGKASVVGETPGWTMEEMMALLADKPEDVSLFGETMTRDGLMYYAMSLALPQFIDRESGQCNFESEGFKGLLEFLKTLPTEYVYDDSNPDYWTEMEMQYRNEKTLLMTNTIYSVPDLIYTFGSFGTTDVTFIGFPCEDGVGAILSVPNRYAISAQSPNQEGAWEFMRYYYTDEFQDSIYNMPVNKEIWMEYAMEATERPSWENENGEIIYEDYMIWMGSERITLEPFTEEKVKEIFDYVSGVNQVYSYDEQLIDIINEEAAPFFEGKKTVEEVAKIIQGRIQIYMDEKG